MPRVTEAHRISQRQRILDAALTCFDRSGFHRTTMTHIIGESGLSAGAIYSYFDSKDAIVEAIAADRHERERALATAAIDHLDDPATALRTFVTGYLAWLDDPEEQRRRRVGVAVWAESLHQPRLAESVAAGLAPRAAVAAALEQARQRGKLPADFDAEGFTRIVLALIQGLILQQAFEPGTTSSTYGPTMLRMLEALLSPGPL